MLSTPAESKLLSREGEKPTHMPSYPGGLTEQNMDGDWAAFLSPQLYLLPFAPLGIAVGFRRIRLLLYGGWFWKSQDEHLAK